MEFMPIELTAGYYILQLLYFLIVLWAVHWSYSNIGKHRSISTAIMMGAIVAAVLIIVMPTLYNQILFYLKP